MPNTHDRRGGATFNLEEVLPAPAHHCVRGSVSAGRYGGFQACGRIATSNEGVAFSQPLPKRPQPLRGRCFGAVNLPNVAASRGNVRLWLKNFFEVCTWLQRN